MNNFMSMKKEDARDMCLSMYVGAECKFCKHEFKSVEDIKEREVVCAENSGDGLKFACKKCFDVKEKEGEQ